MGREARKHVLKEYSLKAYAKKYAAIIKKLGAS
jgi:hypothetical protein